MISALVLERPGAWRALVLATLLALVLSPVAPLIISAVDTGAASLFGGSGFLSALQLTLAVVISVSFCSLIIGWPLGTLAGLFSFPGKILFLGLFAVPLIVPCFLWAIGTSNALAAIGIPHWSGLLGKVLVVSSYAGLGVPLVFFAAFLGAKSLAKTQVDRLHLSGSRLQLILQALKSSQRVSILAALIGGVVCLTDPGPLQIFGVRGAASEILVSFSAQYDFQLATRQCLVAALAVSALVLPWVASSAKEVAGALLGRDTQGHTPSAGPVSFTLLFGVVASILYLVPIAGLVSRSNNGTQLSAALNQLKDTALDSTIFAVGGAILAVILGTIVAVATVRRRRLTLFALGASLFLFALPSSLGALGFVWAGTHAPEGADWLLRSRLTVCLALGFRFFPVAALLLIRQIHQTSPTWTQRGAVEGISFSQVLQRLWLPFLAPAMGTAFLICMLLALSEVGAVILLRPPGTDSYVSRYFAVMANAPEGLVASMGLVLLMVASLAVGLSIIRSRRYLS